jgi:hypothetical protein
MSREEFLNWQIYYELKAEEAAKREEEQRAEQEAIAAKHNK